MVTKTHSVSKVTTFRWRGKDDRGEIIMGEIEGSSIAAVKAHLRSQKIIPLKVRKKSKALFSKQKRIKGRDISIFTRQMATMLTSGIPLVQSFDIVGKGHPNPSVANLIAKLKQDVEEGRTLCEAMEKHPAYFNDLYCSLVKAGEQAGALDRILERLATHKEKTESLKGKIRKALFYPAAVIVVAMVVTTALLVFVVPQFQELFRSFGAELPVFTLAVLALSDFVQHYWWLIGGVMVALSGITVYSFNHFPKFVHAVDRLSLKIPIIGPILEKACIARFARTLATTFAAGIPLVDALKTVAKATGNIVYTKATFQISYEISRGQQLQTAIRNTQVFPEMLIQMVAIGEEAGELEQMLTKVADFFEEEVDNAVDGLSSLIEPIIMAVLGALIGALIVAMYLPIFKLGSVV